MQQKDNLIAQLIPKKYRNYIGMIFGEMYKQIIFEMFKYSALSGGSYLNPQGEPITRCVIANHYNEMYGLNIDYNDLVLLQGVSHGIATMFKIACDERMNFLKKTKRKPFHGLTYLML